MIIALIVIILIAAIFGLRALLGLALLGVAGFAWVLWVENSRLPPAPTPAALHAADARARAICSHQNPTRDANGVLLGVLPFDECLLFHQ